MPIPIGSALDVEMLRRFPKVELHVHVEACLTAERVEELAAELGVPMLRPVDRLYEYDSLASFLRTYEWWCDLLRTPDIAEQLAYDAAAYMAGEGTVYAEVLTGPKYWPHLRREELIDALGAGFERAHADGHCDCRLMPSISREQSPEWAMELVEWIGASRPRRVVGIGLDGDETVTGRTCPKFEAAYQRAGELGLGRTVHAGESSGPEGVWDALTYLRVDRIDHGVRAAEDPTLVRRLADERITLNICPSSNVMLGLYPSLAQHSIGPLIEAGVPVTVNTDDPLAMNINLAGELLEVGATLGWTIDDVAQVTRNALDAAFCDRETALHLRSALAEFLADLRLGS